MRILLVTESYWPNADGGALFERRLAHGLVSRGHHVGIWTPGPSWRRFDETDGPTTIHRERGVTFWFNTKYKVSLMPFWRARHIIRQERPDVLHIHNCYWMGLSALFWARRYRVPVVATNHFMPENALLNISGTSWLYQPLHNLIWKYLVWFHNRVDYVTSPTPTAVQLLLDHRLKAPAKAVSNGIDTAVFKSGLDASSVQAKYKLATDRPVVLYVGRLDGEKRLDLLIAAWPLIKKQHNAQLVLCGFGKAMAGLQAQAATLGVSDDVVFTGYIDEAEKPLIYNTANLFVISSPAELQSIVTLEAMASGLPIAAVDIAALSELCHDGENGYLFKLDDPADLARAVNAILDDKALAKRFGQASMEIVQRHHSTEAMFETYEAVYRHATKQERD
jgi:glycosyltransferase involved in cell wall biosynthesis